MIDIATILNGYEKVNLEVTAASGGIPNSLCDISHTWKEDG